MPSIAATNVVYPAYRNSVAGKTSDYATRVNLTTGTDVAYGFFYDNASGNPDDGHVFHSSYTAGETPTYAAATANPGARLTVTTPTTNSIAAAGIIDATDYVFTVATVLPAGNAVESYIIAKFINPASASPVLVHFGSATGLPFTPTGADVTVAYNSSGIWKF
jgi:phosphoribosylformylglycinamidine (FGAM) synthase-like enzyme